MQSENQLEIWGGVECTINRVGDQYFDQMEYSGHYLRGEADIDLIASLGIKTLRYPVLWEKHLPRQDQEIDWSFTEKMLNRLREHDINPIAGLVHHGSGPDYVNFFDGSFEKGLEDYATKVINKFPWLTHFTPVNEPLTTARFCGLYGLWYPHGQNDYTCYKVLLSECKATVLAMKAIRKVNPNAQLVQTEDLSKCYSTPLLAYQAKFENNRRWLSYDILCGKVNPKHFMWKYMLKSGIQPEEILYFTDNNCVPDIAGFNYYITSERYLDEDIKKYPQGFQGGNGRHNYIDIHTVHIPIEVENGPALLLQEAWEHLQIPLAITECHLHSSREDQMRWFNGMLNTVNTLRDKGVDIRAITAWAIFGLTGWNRLCTQPGGMYEPGVFNLSSGQPRPTAMVKFLQQLTKANTYHHPVLDNEGWWQRENRQQFGKRKFISTNRESISSGKPLVILGSTGTLGFAFSRICEERNIHHISLGRKDLDITDIVAVEQMIQQHQPWAIVNAAGYVKVDEAENEPDVCMNLNGKAPAQIAALCAKYGIRFITYSTDLVFDGKKKSAYTESDYANPLNIYGKSKAIAEVEILENNPDALILRTSSFFGPWDKYNFVYYVLEKLEQNNSVTAANDIIISPTYVPDLVNESLDLLLDGCTGIFHITNNGQLSWADFACLVADSAGYDSNMINGVVTNHMHYLAKRPLNSVLKSEKGVLLPNVEDALKRFLNATGLRYKETLIAV